MSQIILSNSFDVLNDLDICNPIRIVNYLKQPHQIIPFNQLKKQSITVNITYLNTPNQSKIKYNQMLIIIHYGIQYIPKSNEVVLWYLRRKDLATDFNNDNNDVVYYYTTYDSPLSNCCYIDIFNDVFSFDPNYYSTYYPDSSDESDDERMNDTLYQYLCHVYFSDKELPNSN